MGVLSHFTMVQEPIPDNPHINLAGMNPWSITHTTCTYAHTDNHIPLTNTNTNTNT